MSVHLKLDPALAVAVLAVESGGRAFERGRLVIRLELHQLYERWETFRSEFELHFRFRRDRRWLGHQWRPTSFDVWQAVHRNQDSEWAAFDLVRGLDKDSAYESTSMGLPQIMGFNADKVGYGSAEEMFHAFERSEAAQVLALFDFVRNQGLVEPLLRGDLERFAAGYNGRGNAAKYAQRIASAAAVARGLLGGDV